MRWFKLGICGVALCVLLGCDNSDAARGASTSGTPSDEELAALEAQTTLTTQFRRPDANGSYSKSLSSLFRGSYRDGDGNGYAIGLDRNGTDITALVGLLPGTTGGSLPASGTASMSGRYHVAEISKSNDQGRDYAEPHFTLGQIRLNVNFAQGILRGSDGTLSIDASFQSKHLQGQAVFNGRGAVLDGRIGTDRAVGVFHGTDSDTAMVGGFMVTR